MAAGAAAGVAFAAGPGAAAAALFGAAVGVAQSGLLRRSAWRAAASPRHGMVVMFSGLVLRYAVVILGLAVGFYFLRLNPLPMLGGFVLMVAVQAFAALLVKPSRDRV